MAKFPSFLADKRLLAVDLSLIVAGTKYRGQFEGRLKTADGVVNSQIIREYSMLRANWVRTVAHYL
jgi:ATP-dependent Clp protease ATP-binding subunit ClpA